MLLVIDYNAVNGYCVKEYKLSDDVSMTTINPSSDKIFNHHDCSRTKMSVLSLFEVFFTNTLLLYCLSYHVSAVPGDVFVNSFMMGLSSAPAYYWLYM